MTDEFSVGRLLGLLTAYQAPAAITAAARLGLFDVLDEPSTAPEAAHRVGADPASVASLMEALGALGVLDGSGGWFCNTEVSARLATGGDLRFVLEKEAFFAGVWGGLAETVRTGRPRLGPWPERLVQEPERVREFLSALVVLAREGGPDLVELCGIGPATTAVDLGGGYGSVAVPLAQAGAEVVLVDLPPVIAWAQEHLHTLEPDLRRRIRCEAVDLLEPGAAGVIGVGHDIAVIAHLLHDLDDEHARTVLDVARTVTRPGGSVVVVEIPGDAIAPVGPLFDLMMRIESPGRARRLPELVALLRSSGLADVRPLLGAPTPHAVIRGVVT